ncbi:MAG: cyclodeaminase/cyclohydrolase family protein [Candidatus Woesebacteria bacterium]|nr:MAG: cyclodeaminase/cyclohydrolase family protein [Candidatus Woesebacteria bacterium]
MVNKQTIEEFQRELSSKNPTPGGGVVAALAASFAASLIEMVVNLTIGKKGYEDKEKILLKIAKDTGEIKKRLAVLAEEDAKAYQKVMEAYKMDKENPNRAQIIKKSLKYAIEVPMEVRKLSHELEELGYRVSRVGNKNAVSDGRTAIHLARAAAKSALENIKINKSALAKL